MNKRKWAIGICLLALFILYITGRLTNTLRDVLLAGAAGAFMIGAWENEMRYGSGWLISPTMKASIDLESKLPIDDWRVLPLGSIKSDSWQIFTKGGQGTLVYKVTGTEDAILYRCGENALLMAEPKPITELDLPGRVRDLITGRRGFGPPYYLADKPINPKPVNVQPTWDIKAAISELEALRRERNIYKDAYHGKTGMIDKELGRITGAARSMAYSNWQRWFRKLAGHGEEQEKPPQ